MFHSHIAIQTADFDVSQELAALRAGDARIGAVCCFIGTVRDRNRAPRLGTGVSSLPPEGAPLPWGGPAAGGGGTVTSMELEHYPGMTEKSIAGIVEQARQRFEIFGARVIHRVGLLAPEAQIVLVAVSSAHRGQSFLACEYLMDYLKTQAPFWKKEQTPEGARWVDARVSDDEALARWERLPQQGS